MVAIVVVMVLFLPITTVLVTICMVWYTGDCLRGVTPSLAITILGESKAVICVHFVLPATPERRDFPRNKMCILPAVANGDLLINSLQLHKLVNIVNE